MAFGGFFLLYKTVEVSDDKKLKDPDPYPSRLPASAKKPSKRAAPETVPEPLMGTAAAIEVSREPVGFTEPAAGADKMVWAYYNPFSASWQRIPDGFEPPAAMDLTAWHKKRTDPVEWSRLLAEGTLSQMIPRGGLKVRYRPSWDTFEPVLVKDPVTQKTVQVTEALLRRQAQPKECEVKF